ncbi:ATP-dependent DNA helicase [Halorarius halobius]|uniref:ATP-dependent DNA helicase n=1 Tax=Halorarius halobius TaxID=2962671 RepID=UPI0020CCA5A0|nr:ATP-dependent DNA helicase [Halorarius halobius]
MAAGPLPENVTEAGDWRDVFGHEEPYPEQADGIDAAVETARENGFLAVEGACGTGKTMLALTAGVHLVRDPDSSFERVVVLTSVKQQLRQFEADLRTMNANLPDDYAPVTAMTLVGKADVCPYNITGTAGIDDETVYERCEGLRERTRGLTEETTAGALASQARSQQVGLADSGREGAEFMEVLGEPTPYPPDTAEYADGMADVEYCPFYAQFLDDLPEEGDPAEAVPFDFTDMGLIESEDLVRLSAGHGTCPHSMMGAVLPHVEVVVGNYYHAFDPVTVGSFTGALLDSETFVVCDEAHMLEPRVRDLVSDSVADASLRDAESELARVVQPLTLDGEGGQRTSAGLSEARDLIRAELDDADVTVEELQRTREFLRDLREELDRRVTAHLNAEHRGWRANMTDLPDAELPLRDPEEPAPDGISEWADRAGYTDAVWSRAETVGAVVSRILDEAEDEDKQRAAPGVGRVLGAWYRNDHENYFREIELERTWDDTEPADSWRRAYNARLSIQNCVPGDAIADQLGEFGGGVLMSATLAPLDVFERVTGLQHLRDEEDRPVERRTYGLGFPEENRASFAVATPKFTHANRGAPGERNETRRVYADAIREVARSPGNVLVGMPNYAEAEWAAEVLSSVDKPVLVDESSRDAVTEDLKSEFFDGEGKVLVTSLRGTLTEGVDYRGDRLSAAVVVGVPIINTASPRTRAVKTAYDREFGDVSASGTSGGSRGGTSRGGFETALTVPAVRKARQAIGRVIRGPEEVGVRVLLDERYARDSWDSCRAYLGPEREEFQPVSPDMLSLGLDRFWSTHGE